MATKNPRLNVVLEPALIKEVDHLAKAQGVSLSTIARDLIREALEMYEDTQWRKIAQQRDASFNAKKALSHHKVFP